MVAEDINESEIRQLLNHGTETQRLDYKQEFHWQESNRDEKAQLVKHILAMANTQGACHIIFGVRDSDYSFVGLEEDQYQSFDTTKVNDFLQKYTDPKFTCTVFKTELDGNRAVVIRVPEFREIPIICKSTVHSSDAHGKLILQEGAIYIRTQKATSETVPSSHEMRELIDRAVEKQNGLSQQVNLLRTMNHKAKQVRQCCEKFRNSLQAGKKPRDRISTELNLEALHTFSGKIYGPISNQELISDFDSMVNELSNAEGFVEKIVEHEIPEGVKSWHGWVGKSDAEFHLRKAIQRSEEIEKKVQCQLEKLSDDG